LTYSVESQSPPVIQAGFRGWRERVLMSQIAEVKREAAVFLQSHIRRHQVRKRIPELVENVIWSNHERRRKERKRKKVELLRAMGRDDEADRLAEDSDEAEIREERERKWREWHEFNEREKEREAKEEEDERRRRIRQRGNAKNVIGDNFKSRNFDFKLEF
jgi:hypothetical protein